MNETRQMKFPKRRLLHLSFVFAGLACFAWTTPQDPAAHFHLGRSLGEAGDMRAAAQEFRRAIQLKEDYPEAHYFLALALIADPIDKLDWPQAASECRQALKYRPAYPEAMHLLGVALAAHGERAAAIDQFNQALRLRPKYAEAHLDLGMAYAADMQTDRAIAEFRQALAARPRYAEAHERLAKCFFEQGKPTDALPELKAALAINPDLADAHYLLGRVFLALRQSDAAKVEFRQLTQLNNRRALAVESTRLSNAGLDAMREGDVTRALSSLRQAVIKKPDSAIAHYNLGLVLADSGDLDTGIGEVRKAISLAPLASKMRATLERMLERKGNPDRALAEAPADSCRRHVEAGQAFAAKGDYLGAVGEYLRALSQEPADRTARCALAAAYQRLGDTENAFLETQKLNWLPPETRQ
jgi:tetratricopeptide (TPR) repeat protein